MFAVGEERRNFVPIAASPYDAIALDRPVFDKGESRACVRLQPTAQKGGSWRRKESSIVVGDGLPRSNSLEPIVSGEFHQRSSAEADVAVGKTESGTRIICLLSYDPIETHDAVPKVVHASFPHAIPEPTPALLRPDDIEAEKP